MVHQDRHAHLVFRQAMTQTLQVRVLIVEAGEDLADRAEDAPLLQFGRIAPARSGAVVVQIIGQAAAVAVVKSGAAEVLAVLDVCGAAESNLLVGVETVRRIGQGRDHRLFERGRKAGHVVVREQVSNPFELVFERLDRSGREAEARQTRGDLLSQRLSIGERLIQKRIPQIEGEGHGHVAVAGNGAAEDRVVGRLAAEIANIIGTEEIHRRTVLAQGLDRLDRQRRGLLERKELGGLLGGHGVVGIDEIHEGPAVPVVGPQHNAAIHQVDGLPAVGLLGQVHKGNAVRVGQDRDVTVGCRGRQADHSGQDGDLRRHGIGQQDVTCQQIAAAVGRVDLIGRDVPEAADRPALRIDRVAASPA